MAVSSLRVKLITLPLTTLSLSPIQLAVEVEAAVLAAEAEGSISCMMLQLALSRLVGKRKAGAEEAGEHHAFVCGVAVEVDTKLELVEATWKRSRMMETKFLPPTAAPLSLPAKFSCAINVLSLLTNHKVYY
jgi:hypothetical protein